MKFSGKIDNGPMNKRLYILVAIRITDLDTYLESEFGKMCLGGGMHCPSASSVL